MLLVTAIRAGYSQNTAKNKASNLLTIVNVRNRIQELMKKRKERTMIAADKILEELSLIGFNQSENSERTSDRLKALELMGKHLGMFVTKVESSVQLEDKTRKENLKDVFRAMTQEQRLAYIEENTPKTGN